MPSPCRRIVLSRFFENNTKLVAGMCSKCYEECLDVQITGANLIFLLQTFKDLNAIDFMGVEMNQQTKESDCDYGFSKEETSFSVERVETLNELIHSKEESIREMKQMLNVSEGLYENVFRGFSEDEFNSSKRNQRKIVKAYEHIRYKICKRANLKALKIIREKRLSKSYVKVCSKRKAEVKTVDYNQNRSKYFSISFDNNITNTMSIKEECHIHKKENAKDEKCKHIKQEDSCINSYENKVEPDKTEYTDHESEYFKYLDERNTFKFENCIKTETPVIKNQYEVDAEEKTHIFTPPRSPHNLIEECLYHDPWALLVATIFLNRTACMCARPYVFWFLKDNPDPLKVLDKFPQDLEKYFVNLGLQKTRAVQVWRMSHDFVYKNWRNVKELYGIGGYGENAFRMFCLGDFSVEPKDRFLRIYKAWYQKIALKEGFG